jgi:Uma2 family endonuclease
MSYPPKHVLTPAEYLALERKALYKSEYFAGEMFAMAGASRRHNLIVANIIRVLGNQLLERDCNVYPSDMRVKISKIEKYTYPDVVVACGKEVFEDEENDTLLTPVVIIEVLSESTEAYDRDKKFAWKRYSEGLEDRDPEEARRIIDPALQRMMEAVHRSFRFYILSTGPMDNLP